MTSIVVSPVINKSVNSNIIYSCKPCGRKFNQAAAYKRHREVTHSPEIERKCVKCRICGNTFASTNTLTMHMVIHNSNKNEFKLNNSTNKRVLHISEHNRKHPISKKLKFTTTDTDNNNNISNTIIVRADNKTSIINHKKTNTAIVKPTILNDNIKIVYADDEPSQVIQVKQEPLFLGNNKYFNKEEIGTVVLNAFDLG